MRNGQTKRKVINVRDRQMVIKSYPIACIVARHTNYIKIYKTQAIKAHAEARNQHNYRRQRHYIYIEISINLSIKNFIKYYPCLWFVWMTNDECSQILLGAQGAAAMLLRHIFPPFQMIRVVSIRIAMWSTETVMVCQTSHLPYSSSSQGGMY